MRSLTVILLILNCSCRTASNQSQPAIIGGEDIAESEYPSVISLWDPISEMQGCTGTFFDEHTVLTAAHCVQPNAILTYLDQVPTKIIRSSLYKSVGDDAFDLALLIFASSSKAQSKIFKGELGKDDELIFVGYGCNSTKSENAGRGIKRKGKNHILKIEPEIGDPSGRILLSFREDQKGAALCAGDSGGPAFREGEIAGVASSGNGGRNQHADLTSDFAKGFLSPEHKNSILRNIPPTIDVTNKTYSGSIQTTFMNKPNNIRVQWHFNNSHATEVRSSDAAPQPTSIGPFPYKTVGDLVIIKTRQAPIVMRFGANQVLFVASFDNLRLTLDQ